MPNTQTSAVVCILLFVGNLRDLRREGWQVPGSWSKVPGFGTKSQGCGTIFLCFLIFSFKNSFSKKKRQIDFNKIQIQKNDKSILIKYRYYLSKKKIRNIIKTSLKNDFKYRLFFQNVPSQRIITISTYFFLVLCSKFCPLSGSTCAFYVCNVILGKIDIFMSVIKGFRRYSLFINRQIFCHFYIHL